VFRILVVAQVLGAAAALVQQELILFIQVTAVMAAVV
jgi:hypothetical protein